MAETNFEGPLTVGKKDTGIAATVEKGFVRLAKQIPLTDGTRTIVTFPANTVIERLQGVLTSALGGTEAASAMNVNFGTSADPTGYGVVVVSGNATGAGAFNETTTVSGRVLDAGGTMVLTMSAAVTTSFTGGARAIVHYMILE